MDELALGHLTGRQGGSLLYAMIWISDRMGWAFEQQEHSKYMNSAWF